MDSRSSPPYPEQLTIALFGKNAELKNTIGNKILSDKTAFLKPSDDLVMAKNASFKVFNTPNLLDEDCKHPDQKIIDFMALSYPGPDLFILAIDRENIQEEKVMVQVSKLTTHFGEDVTAYLLIMLPDMDSYKSLGHLKKWVSLGLTIDEDLPCECKKSCCGRQSFLYDYKNYSQDVVIRRQASLEKRRRDGQTLRHPQGADAEPRSLSTSQYACAGGSANHFSDNMFSIILLGLTGTGKSASANTILTADNSKLNPSQLFTSCSSSVPVTTTCDFKIMEKLFEMSVRVVDTPDFFHDQMQNCNAQVEKCKRYCQPNQCVVLLVIQAGRFTDDEQAILMKLENKLGWRIRDSTIVLLTHGEDLKGKPEQYINSCAPLKKTIELCSNRYHIFSNTCKDNKQVIELIKKFQYDKISFPNLSKNRLHSGCFVC